MRKIVLALSTMLLASAAHSAIPLYGSPGTRITDTTYDTYVAPSSGIVYAWFLGKEAQYTSVISMKVNGVTSPESPIFNNQVTPVPTKAALGYVQAGDSLELLLHILAPPDVAGTIFSSNSANNPDGFVHIHATPYGGGDLGIPLGTYLYVGFEDINGARDPNFRNDWDYDDHRFVFEIAPVPEPASWILMIGGFGLVGMSLRRKTIRSVHA
ncbi:PEPxxWA-CTERM sorting domain-containing protein [Sandaracinobacteroides hominis]|uniref:PEPxxWA-CTERM sorting domain-containing protein n=1 Tax=Sandaracinobacteroides hominis TaxID=2780086 RepID=UPI001F2DB10C|nr:PEPxxWA-CTERM sorting domain-containing protein [Sandaracinobacteroides hominis]